MVSDHNVKRPGRSADLNKCLPAIPRLNHLGRWTSQHHCNHVRDRFFIFDNQDLHNFSDLISRTRAAEWVERLRSSVDPGVKRSKDALLNMRTYLLACSLVVILQPLGVLAQNPRVSKESPQPADDRRIQKWSRRVF